MRAKMPIAPGSRYFLSGVMGGSGAGKSTEIGMRMESQDYRSQVRSAILDADPNAVIVDPLQLGAERAAQWVTEDGASPWLNDAHVRQMLSEVVAAAAASDVVISYLPTASMGSALELQAAHAANKVVLAVAPANMRSNWVVRSYSSKIFDSIAEVASFLQAEVSHAV
jgi:hypothetical protein